ncbi:hypothetical protein CP532_0009 [Ophiocordyceps camponoti-leonardi (nom. inval.)]|nr:hypothetical protein CP532_0009 [Ophiocordyceps camponoti-leonardi (nom. inval.)]
MATALPFAEQRFDPSSSAELSLVDLPSDPTEWQDAWFTDLPSLPSLPQDLLSSPARAIGPVSPGGWDLSADNCLDRGTFTLSCLCHSSQDCLCSSPLVTPRLFTHVTSSLEDVLEADTYLGVADTDWFSQTVPSFLSTPRNSFLPQLQTSSPRQSATLPSASLASYQPPAALRHGALDLSSNITNSLAVGRSTSIRSQATPDLRSRPLTEMPSPRPRVSVGDDSIRDPIPAPKRRRTVSTQGSQQAASSLILPVTFDDDDPFVDDKVKADEDDLPTIDLTNVEAAVPEKPKEPENDQIVKMSTFQCSICLDDAKTVTVTHCGHLFCQECLHKSLHLNPSRGLCPVCRAKIDMKPRSAYTSKTKGYWPLELKFVTVDKKGKRKADSL